MASSTSRTNGISSVIVGNLFRVLLTLTTLEAKFAYDDWNRESVTWEKDGTWSEKYDTRQDGYVSYHDPFMQYTTTPHLDAVMSSFGKWIFNTPGASELSNEDKQILQDIVSSGKKYELPFVLQLISSSSEGVSNVGVRTSDMNAVELSILDTIETLDALVSGQRIFNAYDVDAQEPKAGDVVEVANFGIYTGQMRLMQSIHSDFVDEKAHDYGTLIHESGHRYSTGNSIEQSKKHNTVIGQELAHIPTKSKEYGERVLELADYQYYLTGIFGVAERILMLESIFLEDAEGRKMYARHAQSEQGMEILADAFAKTYFAHPNFLMAVGVDQNELANAITGSHLLEYGAESLRESGEAKESEVESEGNAVKPNMKRFK